MRSVTVRIAGQSVKFTHHAVERYSARTHREPETLAELAVNRGHIQIARPRGVHINPGNLKHLYLTEAWLIIPDEPRPGGSLVFPLMTKPGGGCLMANTTIVRFPPREDV